MTSHERWELLDVSPLDKMELEGRIERFTPREGDRIDDQPLGLSYVIGSDTVSQGNNRFRLPAGERITRPLDKQFLQRLATLQHVDKSAAPAVLQRHERHIAWSALLAATLTGFALIIVGILVLLTMRKRAAA